MTFAITVGKKRPISHNKKREAVAPIAGYVYQFWQSAYAWIHLSEGEILILEAAEDFDIHTDTPDVETVQVKLSGKAITLRSPDVVEAIGHYWDHVHANPRHTIRFRFLTTATPTVEQGEPFGRAVAGISFWNPCRTDTEIESIRDFLLALDIPAALKNFLRTANTSDIKQTFLNRIRWDTGAMSADAIARATEAAVTVQAARFGILPEDASKITDRLVVEVIKKLISSDRALTAEDYLRFLEQEATVRIARSRLIELESLEAKVRKPEGGAVSFGGVAYRGLPPLDRRICRRTELVNDLADRLEQDGAVILQGGTGTGKTILAALVSATSSMDVWWVRLRGFSARETATALMRLSEEIENGSPKTLVLDDLDLSRAIQHYEFGLRVLAYQARFLGVNIIVTSQAPATRQALSILGDGTVTRSPEVKVAPLSEAEVRDLLLQNGVADDKNATFWARLLRATTRGHPQLVDARIANLRERGWPQDSMEDLIGSEVIRDTKIELRKRLMDDVPTESARTLAYRLSILDFPFKRDLALTLGSLAPELKNPGDALDLLIGPWIEVIEKDSYRISPLLEDAASEVWAAKQVQQLKASAAEALGKKEHITPWEGSGGLALALASKNKEVLTHWLYALLNTPENILAKVALAFEWVALIGARKGERAYAEDSALNNLLRFFQFRVSAESSEPERAIKIAQSWLGEINSFTGEKKRLALLLYYAQIVMRYTVPFSPTIVVTSLAKLFQEKESILKNAFSESMGGLPWLGDVQITGELVLLQIQILRKWTPDQIVEFLSAVGDQPEPTRSLMLRMFRIDEEAVSVMVNKVTSSLPDDSNVGTFDRYLAVLRQIADKGIEWNARPLSASAFRAIAVLQSENIKDPQAALRTLDQATTLIGETAVLTDQKARVYFYSNEYEKALAIWDDFLPGWEKAGSFDRPFSIRWAGIAASRTKGWQAAFERFKFGHESTTGAAHYRVINVGFKGDMAFAKWKAGDRAESLRLFSEVLTELETLPSPSKDIKTLTLEKRVGHTISWIVQDTKGEYIQDFAEPGAGCMSNMETFEELRSYPSLPNEFLWSLLASAERAIGVDVKIRQRFLEKAAQIDSPVLQSQRNWFALEQLFKNADFDRLVSTFLGIVIVQDTRRDPYLKDFPRGPDKPPEITAEVKENSLRSLIFAASLCLRCRDIPANRELINRWEQDVEEGQFESSSINDLFTAARRSNEEPISALIRVLTEQGDSQEARLFAAINIVGPADVDPKITLYAHLCVWDFFRRSGWKYLIEEDFERVVSHDWTEIATERTFSLLSPRLSAPAILKACDNSKKGLSKVAAVLLAAIPAVGLKVPHNLANDLQEVTSEADS